MIAFSLKKPLWKVFNRLQKFQQLPSSILFLHVFVVQYSIQTKQNWEWLHPWEKEISTNAPCPTPPFSGVVSNRRNCKRQQIRLVQRPSTNLHNRLQHHLYLLFILAGIIAVWRRQPRIQQLLNRTTPLPRNLEKFFFPKCIFLCTAPFIACVLGICNLVFVEEIF